ncbi:cysteine rich repeat-containing protein [uncultured Rhodoblastus sp.]|uniref:cysteine rich repeat-containing protein n=1 Tax=uncultured Rhodoblastus sp. TaxID=543037 RepID=UPI0025E7876F|nr:cysteine rich repeat-containing protein [uncultured Rhodoblastus sp.]
MKFRLILLPLLLAAAAPALAGSGTAEQQDACRPDVRRFCHKIRADAGDGEFLACLQANRARLSVNCRAVLESHGM